MPTVRQALQTVHMPTSMHVQPPMHLCMCACNHRHAHTCPSCMHMYTCLHTPIRFYACTLRPYVCMQAAKCGAGCGNAHAHLTYARTNACACARIERCAPCIRRPGACIRMYASSAHVHAHRQCNRAAETLRAEHCCFMFNKDKRTTVSVLNNKNEQQAWKTTLGAHWGHNYISVEINTKGTLR